MWLFKNKTAIALKTRMTSLKIIDVDRDGFSFVFRHYLFIIETQGENIKIQGRPLNYLSESNTFTSLDEVVNFLLNFNK